MATWKDLMTRSFGSQDHIFSNHSYDTERAWETLKEAVGAGAAWKDIEAEARRYLSSKGCDPDFIDDQIKSMGDVRNWIPLNVKGSGD